MKNNLGKHLLRSFTRNLGLKLLALISAFGLWFIVNNITDPSDSKSFSNIPVEILNADLITNEGKVYEILDDTDVISVRVRGKTSVLKYITKEDIKATADMSELTFMNTVNIKVTSTRNNSELEFVTSNDNLRLAIEDVKRTQLSINTTVSGHPADGYIVGTVTPSQNVVRLSGPESVINQIDHVEAVANIGNYAYSSDINTSVDLLLYDSDGNEIKNNSIKMNISSINVAITILATKEVPLSFVISGETAEGYMVSGDIVSAPETITLAGRKATLDAISELSIADEALNINDKDSDMTTIINIKKYLPTGVQFADATYGGNVSVTVPIAQIVSKTFEVPKKNFAIANAPQDFDTSIQNFADEDVTSFAITLMGTEKNINALREKDIVGVVDMQQYADDHGLTEWKAGVYSIPVVLNVSDEYTTAEQYQLSIEVKEIEEE